MKSILKGGARNESNNRHKRCKHKFIGNRQNRLKNQTSLKSALNIFDDKNHDAFIMAGITEQSFIHRHEDAIKKIEERSDKLKSIINKYTKDNSYADELFDNPGKAEQSKPQIYASFEDEIEKLTQINKMLK